MDAEEWTEALVRLIAAEHGYQPLLNGIHWTLSNELDHIENDHTRRSIEEVMKLIRLSVKELHTIGVA